MPPDVEQQLLDRWEKQRAKKDFRQFPRLLFQAITLVWGMSRTMIFAIVAMRVVAALLSGVMLLLGRNAIAVFSGAGRVETIDSLGRVGAVFVVSTILGLVSGELETFLTAQVQRKTMDELLDVATSVRLEAYESPQFFDHLKRVETNALTEPATVVRSLMQLPGDVVGIGAVMGALIALQPLLLPIVLVSIVPLALIGRLGARRQFEFAKERVLGDRQRDYLRSVLTGKDEAKELRAFGSGVELRSRYERLYDAYLVQLRRFRRKQMAFSLLRSISTFAIVGIWAVFVGSLFVSGRTSGANLGAAAVAMPLLLGRVFGFVQRINGLYTSSLFIQDYRDFLQLKPSLQVIAQPSAEPVVAGFGELVVEDVSFTYPGSATPALQGVNLTIRSGEVVALVGENGSGKTTLAKLLARLFHPGSGRVLWDGLDVASLDAAGIQQHISVIFQDFVRYQLSAHDNIGLGRSAALANREAIVSAASAAGADEFLGSLAHGYETILSKAFGGIDISIGQWQRVALARAFFRNAPFIILDEPTASLDARAEHALFDTIRGLRQGRTILLISHRFSTVRSADRIYVLKDGTIVESGSHDELMALGRLYAELYNLQASTTLNPSVHVVEQSLVPTRASDVAAHRPEHESVKGHR
jgi:ATP-binding cassette, subfamily B, bacterial